MASAAAAGTTHHGSTHGAESCGEKSRRDEALDLRSALLSEASGLRIEANVSRSLMLSSSSDTPSSPGSVCDGHGGLGLRGFLFGHGRRIQWQVRHQPMDKLFSWRCAPWSPPGRGRSDLTPPFTWRLWSGRRSREDQGAPSGWAQVSAMHRLALVVNPGPRRSCGFPAR